MIPPERRTAAYIPPFTPDGEVVEFTAEELAALDADKVAPVIRSFLEARLVIVNKDALAAAGWSL